MNFNTKEVGKLIQFAYDLHEKGLNFYETRLGYVPNFKFNNGDYPYIKKIDKGAIFGFRGYPDHSNNTLYTKLGVVIGNHSENSFKYIKSIMFEASNTMQKSIYIANLKPNSNNTSLIYDKNNLTPILTTDYENSWNGMTEKAKLDYFLEAMEIIGFKREDVLDVLTGKKTAEQAFTAVAPLDIVNKRWVNCLRRHFVFDGNTLIKGALDSISLDSFSFPFGGPAIIDCSKVKTSCVKFGENIKGHKLINVNNNPYSIRYTNIKNAVIDEVIDLSLVDATWTKFGHHKVKNLNKSIAALKDIDLRFVTDEHGNNFEVNENGVVQLDEFGNPKLLNTSSINVETEKSETFAEINILANADNAKEAKSALENGADGIGLIRTEHMFFDDNGIPLFISLFIKDDNYFELLEKCAQIQKIQAVNILKSVNGKRVVFRLLDAKLNEFINCVNDYRISRFNFKKLRGAELLLEFPDIIKMQAKEIFEAASETEVPVDILVPMITDEYQFSEIKNIIDSVANENRFNNYRVGAMIENITMANNADTLAKDADFISFGTNDLTESVTGLSRNSGSEDFIILNDKVKALIKEGIYRAKVIKPSIVVGICGEHASQLDNLEFINTIDVDYISCIPNFIPTARYILTNIENRDISQSKKKCKEI